MRGSLHQIGVISDTHGLIRPEALEALRGSQLIIHCGDIGKVEVLEALRIIAPVRAVRGNIDKGEWASDLPADDVVQVGACAIYVLHNLSELDLDPRVAGFNAVLSGHSHQPKIEQRGNVLFLNPGSAGPRRFKLPIAVATLSLRSARWKAQIVPLPV